MINSIGLENVGVEGFREKKLPFLRASGTNVVVNFFGETFDEYVACGAALDAMDGVHALEMNVSCPNIKKGGVEFGTDPAVLRELVKQCRAVMKKPLIIKLTPNCTDVVALARAAMEGGADGLSVINTLSAMAIDARKRRPRIATTFGGLSGPAIKPIALRMVYQVHRAHARRAHQRHRRHRHRRGRRRVPARRRHDGAGGHAELRRAARRAPHPRRARRLHARGEHVATCASSSARCKAVARTC